MASDKFTDDPHDMYNLLYFIVMKYMFMNNIEIPSGPHTSSESAKGEAENSEKSKKLEDKVQKLCDEVKNIREENTVLKKKVEEQEEDIKGLKSQVNKLKGQDVKQCQHALRKPFTLKHDTTMREDIYPLKEQDKEELSESLKACNNILEELFSEHYSILALQFYAPLNAKRLGYHSIIKKPMDLRTIQYKLDNHKYKSADDFAYDMRLIYTNCFRHYNQNDDIVMRARMLQDFFEMRFAKIPDEPSESKELSNDSSSSLESGLASKYSTDTEVSEAEEIEKHVLLRQQQSINCPSKFGGRKEDNKMKGGSSTEVEENNQQTQKLKRNVLKVEDLEFQDLLDKMDNVTIQNSTDKESAAPVPALKKLNVDLGTKNPVMPELKNFAVKKQWRQCVDYLSKNLDKSIPEYKQLQFVKDYSHILAKAVEKGFTELINLFLNNGLRVDDIVDNDGNTLLFLSVKYNQSDLAKFLMRKGADIFHKNSWGKVLIHICAEKGNMAVMHFLMSQGVDINKRDLHGRSALMFALREGHLDMVKLLLEKGADIDVKTVSRETPLHQSADKGYADIVKYLIERGADINARDIYKRTPLILAAKNGHTSVVQLLLADEHCDTAVRDMDGRTAIERAIEKKHDDVVKLLANYI